MEEVDGKEFEFLGEARGSGGLATEAPRQPLRGTTVWVLASARAGVEGCHSSAHPRGGRSAVRFARQRQLCSILARSTRRIYESAATFTSRAVSFPISGCLQGRTTPRTVPLHMLADRRSAATYYCIAETNPPK